LAAFFLAFPIASHFANTWCEMPGAVESSFYLTESNKEIDKTRSGMQPAKAFSGRTNTF
jgi:hypothetical protein